MNEIEKLKIRIKELERIVGIKQKKELKTSDKHRFTYGDVVYIDVWELNYKYKIISELRFIKFEGKNIMLCDNRGNKKGFVYDDRFVRNKKQFESAKNFGYYKEFEIHYF